MRGATILVVDDEAAIRRLLRQSLETAGYQVVEAGTAAEAVSQLAREPALILLDLGLPDRAGLELLPLIRKRSAAAILVVSARDETDDKVTALDLGAADYVTKPFDTTELLARIRVALRARVAHAGGRTTIEADGLSIDLVDRRILRDGVEVHLTPKEFAVLAELARFPGRAITHRHLLATVWPNEKEGHVEYLRVVVRNIRQKLERQPMAPTLIVNDPGVGYRFVPDLG